MDVWKKCFQAVMDFIEIYMPMCWFILLFVAFILQIISRYIFNNPLVWPYELAQISYVWIITLGCCYAQRTDDNIVFSVIYELVGEKVRRLFRFLQDILIVAGLSGTAGTGVLQVLFYQVQHGFQGSSGICISGIFRVSDYYHCPVLRGPGRLF